MATLYRTRPRGPPVGIARPASAIPPRLPRLPCLACLPILPIPSPLHVFRMSDAVDKQPIHWHICVQMGRHTRICRHIRP